MGVILTELLKMRPINLILKSYNSHVVVRYRYSLALILL